MISKVLIFINTDFKDKESLLTTIIERAREKGFITDAKRFYDKVMERERILPTSFEFSVSIPHGKDETVKEPFIIFVKNNHSFIWDQRNQQPIHLIFLIAVPQESGDKTHLQMLSMLSRKFMHEEFRHSLNACKNIEEAYQLLEQFERR